MGRSDTGRTRTPHDFQHRGVCGGVGVTGRGMNTTGGTARHGMGGGGEEPCFSADDRRIFGQDHEWVQDEMAVTVATFQHMRLDTNLEKSRRWFVHPGSSRIIRGSWHISGERRGRE